ncbi:MAG: hypothetical protein NTU93_00040, partial [Arthrobacter sp.]|nr:hypothetical protein [Arthrobacter sp.]
LTAICLSAVSLGVHYLQRDKSPEVSALEARLDSMQLAQIDMMDRIEHWTRRDRVRRLREGADNGVVQQEAPAQVTSKSDLRARLRGGRPIAVDPVHSSGNS